jgi:exopolyphosphatase/guanosine-5'-triphosphate,3'-diphosphate pyrophosphatase
MAQQAAQVPQAPGEIPDEAALPTPLQAPPFTPAIRRFPRHTYGAIDLGTNNCRLLVARPVENGFTVVDAFSRVVRLGEGLGTSGKISQDAMDRAVAALSVCAEKLRRRRVSLARSVATGSLPPRGQRPRFRGAGAPGNRHLPGDHLAEEEARLAMLGCHRLLEPGDGPALIFDIGGGSTELVLIDTDGETPRIRCWWSAPWGVVSLTESEAPRSRTRKSGSPAMAACASASATPFAASRCCCPPTRPTSA